MKKISLKIMNYQKLHDDIINRGKLRKFSFKNGLHRHHIVPKCLGGSDELENISVLTYKEHFLIHKILALKLFPNNRKLIHAFWRMCNSTIRYNFNVSIRDYETAKNLQSISISGKLNPMANSARFGVLNPFYGKKHTEDFKIKKSKQSTIQMTGHKKSQETKDKIGLKHKNKIVSNETKKKLSDYNKLNPSLPMLGKNHSEATKQKMRKPKTANVTCPYCNKKGYIANMNRWHFDNCKQKDFFEAQQLRKFVA